MTRLYWKIKCWWNYRPAHIRVKLGLVTEQTAAPAPTPQHRGRAHGELLMAFSITDSQQVPITISGYTDKKGNPATLPAGAGTPQWFIDNPSLLAITPAADGSSCMVSAVGPEGDGTVSVKVADAQGNPLVSGSFAITVIGGAPVNVVLQPGTPSEQP